MSSPSVSFARFVSGVPASLRRPITLDDARRAVTDGLDRRTEKFLAIAEGLIYGHDRSPYRRLLEHAGCELGDLRELMADHGLEEGLRRLRAEGVYVSFPEFKGRAPVVRGGRDLDVLPSDFVNPAVTASIRSASGGSTGPATQTAMGLAHLRAVAETRCIGYAAHGCLGVPSATWRERFPSRTGLLGLLTDAHFGQVHERWFAPSASFDRGAALRYRLAAEAVIVAARAAGVRLPRPRTAEHTQPEIVARWAAHRAAKGVAKGGKVLVRTGVSLAMRVAFAAREAGLDLSGVTFLGAGEPPTEAKVGSITASAASYVTNYVTTEVGHLGIGCARPTSSNDLHIFTDRCAMIDDRRADGRSALLVTSLMPDAPSVAINLETDDFGVLAIRDCGCPLGDLGLTTHLSDVGSFTKLTGEGVTLVASDLTAIVEHVLPERFGGRAHDYQLVEEEDERGFSKLALWISPRVAIDDEAAVVAGLLDALGSTPHATELREMWRRRGVVVVRREEPVLTARGKWFPVRRRSV